MSRDNIQECIKILQQDTDEKTRFKAVETLWEMGEAAAPALTILLEVVRNDPNNDIRSWAEGAVTRIGRKAIPAVQAFLNDTDDKIRSKGAYLLGEIANDYSNTIPEIVPILLKVLREDPHYLVRYYTCEAIGRILDGEEDIGGAVRVLGHTIGTDEHKSVRESAAKSLGKMKAKKKIMELLRVLEEAKYYDSLKLAIDLLGNMGSSARQAVPILIQILQEEKSDSVRASAATALSDIGGTEAVQALIYAVENDSDYLVRMNAIDAFFMSMGLSLEEKKMAIPVLERVSKNDEDENIRELAQMALENMNW